MEEKYVIGDVYCSNTQPNFEVKIIEVEEDIIKLRTIDKKFFVLARRTMDNFYTQKDINTKKNKGLNSFYNKQFK